MKKNTLWIVVVLVLVVVLGVGALVTFSQMSESSSTADEAAIDELFLDETDTDDVTFEDDANAVIDEEIAAEFSEETKAAHWESNTPLHEDILAAPPVNIVIDFNFDLAAPSEISIIRDGKEYGTGTTTIDANKLALRRTFDATAPDGRYTVNYKACWPDASCHDGSFQFEIDRTLVDSYDDLRNTAAVTISLADFTIDPSFVVITKGTTVKWQNDDEVGHYINTDGHPAHTYYAAQNSKELLTGDSFSLTFNESGYYPYHCSTHPDDMQGVIVVE